MSTTTYTYIVHIHSTPSTTFQYCIWLKYYSSRAFWSMFCRSCSVHRFIRLFSLYRSLFPSILIQNSVKWQASKRQKTIYHPITKSPPIDHVSFCCDFCNTHLYVNLMHAREYFNNKNKTKQKKNSTQWFERNLFIFFYLQPSVFVHTQHSFCMSCSKCDEKCCRFISISRNERMKKRDGMWEWRSRVSQWFVSSY